MVSRVRRSRVTFLLVAVFALAGCGEPARSVAGAVGSPLPDLVLADLADGRTSSLAEYRGRALVVNLWATWCAPCRSEMPSLEHLSRAVRAQNLTVIGISVDSDLNLAREFVLQHGLSFVNLSDPDMARGRAALGIRALPETFVIDRDGRIVARALGARDWATEEARVWLDAALGAGPMAQ